MNEDWSDKYKKSIDCNNPKGFSQRAHCQGRKKEMDEMSHRDATKILKKKNYDLHRQQGGHEIYKHNVSGKTFTLPRKHKQKDLSIGVANAVKKITEEENPRKMYHKHFVAAMKAVPQSQKQMHHRNEMEKYRKQMGSSFIDQVAPKKMAKFDRKIKEDAPTVNTGGGQVAGLGVGDQGEPGIKKRKRFTKGQLLPFYTFVRRKTK